MTKAGSREKTPKNSVRSFHQWLTRGHRCKGCRVDKGGQSETAGLGLTAC